MAEEKKNMSAVSDDEMGSVAGGSTREFRAAWDVINGCYGAGEDCRRRLAQNGLDPNAVMYLADGLAKGYGSVAQDIIANKYGTGQDRKNRLWAAGYDANLAQAIVNGMLMNS